MFNHYTSIDQYSQDVQRMSVPDVSAARRYDSDVGKSDMTANMHGSFGLQTSQKKYANEDVFENSSCGYGGVVPENDGCHPVLSTANSDSDDSCFETDLKHLQANGGVFPFTPSPKRCSTPKQSTTPFKSLDMNMGYGGGSKAYSPMCADNIGRASVVASPVGRHELNWRRLPNPPPAPPPSVRSFADQNLRSFAGQNENNGYFRVPDQNLSIASFASSMQSDLNLSLSPLSALESQESGRYTWNSNRSQAVDICHVRGRSGCCGNVDGSFATEPFSRNLPCLTDTSYMKPARWNYAQKDPVELQAQAYRLAASICVPTLVWSGNLPARNCRGSAYSCKVFLGGVPWDITEANLQLSFGKFGSLRVEWPSNHTERANRNSKGYLYVIFDNENSVRKLLEACIKDFSNGNKNYYYKVTSSRLRRKDVQVIPWQLADSTYVKNGCMSSLGTKTVFVGSLHGMLNAEGLAMIMEDMFGGVVAANIDTDKYKYPIGSGRVVFNCTHSYIKAIQAAFVELRTQKFSKKIQIDPFLEDSMCSVCNAVIGPFFCRDMECFRYFCGTCWQWQHEKEALNRHTPMMRNPRVHDNEF